MGPTAGPSFVGQPHSCAGFDTTPSKHAQQLGASSPASPDVQVPQVEVLRARVEQPHAAAERQPLAAGVGNAVAQPRVPQQLRVGELLPAVQHDALRVRLGHPNEGALGHFAAGAHQPQPGPNSHCLRGVGRGRARRLVLDHHGVRGRGRAPGTRRGAGPPGAGTRAAPPAPPPRCPQIPRPEVARPELAVPFAPAAELGHRRLPALRPKAGAQALRIVALEDAARILVEERVPLPGRDGHGARLLHGRLVRVQELPLAVHLRISSGVMPRSCSSASCRAAQSLSSRRSKAEARISSPLKSW